MFIRILGFDSTEIIDTQTGHIARRRDGTLFVVGSPSWVCRGFSIVNNFGNQTDFLTPAEFVQVFTTQPERLFYKNGKAKFRVEDTDHGTRRTWMNPTLKRHQVYVTT